MEDEQQPPLPLQKQFQLDWQAKLEQLQTQHKEESLQQQKEHMEQLKLLQAQIMGEIKLNISPTKEQVPSGGIKVVDIPSVGLSYSKDPPRQSSSSPLPVVQESPSPASEEDKIDEKPKGLTRAHSMSNPQLSRATVSLPVSPSSSPVRACSTGCTPILTVHPRKVTRSLSHPSLVEVGEPSDQKIIKREDSSDYSGGHSYGFHLPEGPTSSAALFRTSTVESLHQCSEATSIDASPIKHDDEQIKLTLPGDDDQNEDNVQSVCFIPGASPYSQTVPGKGEEGTSDFSSASSPKLTPLPRLVWTEQSPQSSTPAPPLMTPSSKTVVKMSPASQSVVIPKPQYPALLLSPVNNSSVMASPHTTRQSPGSANVTLTSPSTFGRGGGNSRVTNVSLSRASLMEKHKKHVDDLKLYYESELGQLREKVDQLELERSDRSTVNDRRSQSPLSSSFLSTQRSPQPTTPQQVTRQMHFPSSLVRGRGTRMATGTGEGTIGGVERSPSPALTVASVVNESELWMLQSENARLKLECSELRAKVDEGERERHTLEEQIKRMKEHTLDWQGRLDASERMVSVLHERLESTRSQLYDQDKLVEGLRSDLQLTSEELHYWKDQRTQDLEKFKRLFDEFEVLQQENQDVRLANAHLHSQLEEAHNETVAYKTSLDKYQAIESQYKSTVCELEDKLHRLQHVNNRLHSMGTHYQLGGYGSPFNHSDEEKVHLSPRSSSTSLPHHPHQQQRPPATPNAPSTPRNSGTAERRETPSTSTAKAPLTRRKWLESSIQGLIFGGGGEEEDRRDGNQEPPSDDDWGAYSPTPHSGIPSTQSRLPTMVNISSGATNHSPRKRLVSSSPKRPVGYRTNPLQRHSPAMNAVQKVVLGEKDDSGENPANYRNNQNWYDGGKKQAVGEGTVNERGHPSPADNRKKQTSKAKTQSIEERVKKHMDIVSEAEQKLAKLQKEKERLESSLLKTPRTGTRVTRQSKQAKLETERLLEQVVKDIGSVRMVLRRHHALKK